MLSIARMQDALPAFLRLASLHSTCSVPHHLLHSQTLLLLSQNCHDPNSNFPAKILKLLGKTCLDEVDGALVDAWAGLDVMERTDYGVYEIRLDETLEIHSKTNLATTTPNSTKVHRIDSIEDSTSVSKGKRHPSSDQRF